MNPITRLALRTMGRTGGVAALWAWGLLSAALLAQVVAVTRLPGWRCAGLAVGGVTGSAAAMAVQVALVAGPAAALAELRREGSWLALRSFGARGRDLLPAVAIWAGALGVAALIGAHVLAPAAQGWIRAARVDAAVGVRIAEGAATSVGPWALARDGGAVRFAGADPAGDAAEATLGSAASIHVEAAGPGVRVALGPGEAHAADGSWSVQFDALATTVAVATDRAGRVETAERSSADLQARAAAGTLAPYERWIWQKRTAVPLVLMLLAALGLPVGARLRAGPGVALVAGVFWALLRGADALAQGAGCGWALAALTLPSAAAVALAWARWSER